MIAGQGMAKRLSLLMAVHAFALGAPIAGAGQVGEREASDSTSFPDAYLDETACHLIDGMRAARDTAMLAIDSYTAVLRERVLVEWPLGRRPMPFVGGEFAWRVRWSRSEATVAHVLGARARNMFRLADRPDFGWAAEAARYAADPLVDPFSFVTLALSHGRQRAFDLIRSPLEAGAERYYQFRSGDTITVAMPGGESVRAVQVTAIPRVRSVRLAAAILWIEPESFGLARVAYRLAKRLDSEMSFPLRRRGEWWWDGLRIDAAGDEEAKALPDSPLYDGAEDGIFDRVVNRVVDGLLPTMTFDVTAVVADYQLRDRSYWLPHSVRLEMSAGVTENALPSGEVLTPVPMTIDWAFDVEEVVESGGLRVVEAGLAEAPGARGSEPAVRTAAETFAAWAGPTDSIEGEPESAGVGDVVVILPRSHRALTESEFLPPHVRDGPIGGASAALMERMSGELAAIRPGPTGAATGAATELTVSPWHFESPFSSLWLLRSNPVEGVSVGARAGRNIGNVRTSLTVRAATKSLEVPDLRLTMARDIGGVRAVGHVYRSLRLNGSGPFSSPGFWVSDTEPVDYHWAHGGGLQLVPGDGRGRLSLSAFAERQIPHDSIPIDADSARLRYGARLDWRPWRGGIWNEPGVGLNVTLAAVGGDDPHVRGAATGAALVSLGSPGLMLGVEAGAARVWGDPWEGDLLPLGAAGRLRGHEDDHAWAASIWHGRAELLRPTRLVNIGLFADWARADGVHHAAWGVGFALPNGFMRLDLARGIEMNRPSLVAPARYRVHFSANRFF